VRPLRILHVLRAPVGGLFRHVLDLARLQAEHGHEVGIVADSESGGGAAEALKASSRAAGFSPKSPLIEIAGICSHCRER